MHNHRRFLSFLLAGALVITTFGSDIASNVAYAKEKITEEVSTNEEEIIEEVEDVENIDVIDDASDVISESDEIINTESETETKEDVIEVIDPDAENFDTESDTESDTEVYLTKEVDGINIIVNAKEGVLPSDAELLVSKIEASTENQIKDLIDSELGEKAFVEETISFDINIYSESQNGYVQPKDGAVEVRFENVEDAADEDLGLAVYHVEDSLSNATEVALGTTGATDIFFEAEHFSVYTVALYRDQNGAKETTFLVNAELEDGTPIGPEDQEFTVYSVNERYYANRITPGGESLGEYIFEKALYDDFEVLYFEYDENELYAYNEAGESKLVNDGAKITTIYRENDEGYNLVHFYLRIPTSPDVPVDSRPQDINYFYPVKTEEYGKWSGFARVIPNYKDSSDDIYDKTGNEVEKYIALIPEDVEKDINEWATNTYNPKAKAVWYVYKDAEVNPENPGWHIDGYVSHVFVDVNYYKNDGTKDKYGEKAETGVDYHLLPDSSEGLEPILKRDGYIFKGWALEPDGEVVYHGGDEYGILTNALNFFAVWEEEEELVTPVIFTPNVLPQNPSEPTDAPTETPAAPAPTPATVVTPSNPATVVTSDTPAAEAATAVTASEEVDDGDVLGATRETEEVSDDGGAILGARRAGTEDKTNMPGRIITILFAAGIGITLIVFGKKNKEF